nr:hypothetical protein [Tanacetum cinerariifolium]
MANVIPPDHMDDLPVVKPNQPYDVLVIPEPVLVDEDEDPDEVEFEEEEEPQEEENMDIDDEEDENEPELTMEEGAATMENLVRKIGNVVERSECKKLKKELEEARGVVFEERPNEAIDVPVEDEESLSSEPRGSPRDS